MKTGSSLALAAGLACLIVFSGPGPGILAQDRPAAKFPAVENAGFDQQSLALRTALHYEPALEISVNNLVSLYQKVDRIEELIGLYRAHIAQYPDDPGAKAVLIQILRKLNRAEADEMIQAAVQQHPDNSLIQFLLYKYRERRQDNRALESLSRAIYLEKKPTRQDAWLELLLEEAGEGVDRVLAEDHLKRILEADYHTVESLLALADRMHRFSFHELALIALKEAGKKEPNPEEGVEIEVLSAKSEAARGRRDEAAVRLDKLIGRMAVTHWRRSEIMSLRINLLSSEVERKRLMSEARIRFEANPRNESAILEYAELLYASEERAEAAKILVEACKVPEPSEPSRRIEAEALKVLEQLGDDQKLWEFLTERLTDSPERADLRYRLVKSAYLLGKTAEASEDLEMVLAALEDQEERQRRLLELARFLSRVSLNKEAASLFEQVLAADPARLDVRSELAETHIANENRLAAALVLRDLPITEAAIENFTELVQFMIKNEFFLESRRALEKRLESEPESFELSLYLVDVLGRMGDRLEAEQLLLETRKLADTPARYGAWLEAGLSFHRLFDHAEQFFNVEQDRFLPANGSGETEWTPDRIERFLTFCEIGKRGKLEGLVTEALREQLAEGGLPADLKIRLRNLLVNALEKSQDHAPEVEQQLKLLAEEDTARADEYLFRRVLLYHTMQRPDLALESMAAVKIENVRDVGVLRAGSQVLIEYGLFEEARACLEGVTNQDPTDLNNWERRMALLAAMGREDELRKAMRHLLAGVDQINLGPESLGALQLHLLDSYWRTISQLLAEGSDESYAEIIPYLEAVERETLQAEDRLWSLWVRAYVLNAQERTEVRDGVITQLIRQAEAIGDANTEPAIVFPDGLAVTIKAAIDLLRESPGQQPAELVEGEQQGPLGDLELAWGFESDPGTKIIQIEPIPDGLLVLDDQGTVYRVASSSGKLIWRERFGLPDEPRNQESLSGGGAQISGSGLTISNRFYQVQQQGASISVRQLVAPFQTATIGPGAGTGGAAAAATPASRDVSGIKLARRFETDGERFYLPFGNEIQARFASDGSLAWAAFLEKSDHLPAETALSSLARPGMHLTAKAGRLLAFLPETGFAACFDAEGGKLLWMRELPAGERTAAGANDAERLFSLNTGAAFSSGRMFVYGTRSFVLDSATGKVVWSFQGSDVRTFPVDLVEAAEEKLESEPDDPAVSAAMTAALPERKYLDHLSNTGEEPEAVKHFLQYRGSLVAPAVHWSGSRLRETAAASAVIESGKLLLMGSDGVRQISLRLPLASRHFDVDGVFLGLAGTQAWFLNGEGLTRIDLNTGQVHRIPANGGADGDPGIRAVLSGSRLYVVGERGGVVLNAHSGGRIAEMPWPAEFVSYLEKATATAEAPPAGESVFTWQGIARHQPGLPPYSLPIIDRVAGSILFTRVDDSRIAAIRSPEEKPEKPAP